MPFRLKLWHKGLIILAIPLMCVLVLFGTLGSLLKQAEDEVYRERHAKQVIAESNGLMKNFMDSAIDLYLYNGT